MIKKEEPILQDNKDRFVLFPIQHDDIWQFYKKAEASFWTAEEIDLQQDLIDWETLNENEKFSLRMYLPSLLLQMGLLMRILLKTLYLRFNILRQSFSMDSRLLWRIFTQKPILY